MKLFILITGLIPVIVLVICGIAIKYQKAYWLISGYNTMSAEKKRNVDIESLGKLVGNICFFIAGIVLTASILIYAGKTTISLPVFALLLPTVIYTLIKAQTYDGNTRNSKGKMKKGTKALIGVIIGVIVCITISVGVLLYFSSKPADYTIQNGVFKISGMYGQEILINQLTSVEIKENIPEVITRTNGSGLGTMLKGYFKLKDIGEAKLFVDASKTPFIYLKTKSNLIILNCEESKKTKELYQEILNKWSK